MDRKEYLKNYSKEWRNTHKEHIKLKAREYYHKIGSQVRQKNVLKNKLYRHRIRKETIEHYGGMCQCCGETIIEFLCFDHINNDGHKHRKEMTDMSIAPWLKRNGYPDIVQVLCHNCNIAKGVYGKCPHKK